MVGKKIALSTVFALLLFAKIKATTWTTVASGNWTTAAVWQNNTVPSFTSSDTFVIKHSIYIYNNLTFNSNAFLRIDSTGGICGHNKITFNPGSVFLKYGTLDLDTMAIPGGHVAFYPPGAVILTNYGVLSNGGQLNSYGCAFSVGPWFNCQFGDYGGVESFTEPSFTIYPNPTSNSFVVQTPSTQKQTLQLFDVNGKLVLVQIVNGSATIDAGTLANGIYSLTLTSTDGVINKRLVVLK